MTSGICFGILYQLVGSTVDTDSCQSSEALYGIRCLPEEYTFWIFWEMTSRIISVLNTLWFDSGYMSLSGYEAFLKWFTLST